MKGRLLIVLPGLLAGCTALSGLDYLTILANGEDEDPMEAGIPPTVDAEAGQEWQDVDAPPHDAVAEDAPVGTDPRDDEDGGGGVDAEAGIPPKQPCTLIGREAALCATFDEDPFDEGFFGRVTQGGATLSASTSASVSTPRSLLVQTPASASNAAAYLKGAVAKPRSSITMSTSMMPSAASITTTAFQLEFGPDEIKVRMGAPPTFRETIVGANDVIVSDIDLPPIPDRRWTKVTLALRWTSNSSTATVYYGNTAVLTNHPIRAHNYPSPVELKVGSITGVTTGGAGFQLRFDNVVVEHD